MNAELQLMPFQADGVGWLRSATRGLLIWDAGTGKTPTAVTACTKVGAKRVLVFCPPIATSVWASHFEQWGDQRPIRVLDTEHAKRPYDFFAGTGVRIIPYSRARPDTAITRAACFQKWDVAILDEGHYLKNASAQRTRAVYGVKTDLEGSPLKTARHVWVLTGTPLLNHPAEFWTHLHALGPDLLIFDRNVGVMNLDFFTRQFCTTQNTPYGLRVTGGRNTEQLARLVKPIMNRKRLRDVLKDMPELRIVEYPLPADTEIDPLLRAELATALDDLDPETLNDDELLAALQAGSVAFSTVRRLIGRAKMEPAAELVGDMLDDAPAEKVIVFAHHREVIRDLSLKLDRYNPLVIVGSTPPKVREANIMQFQNNPGRRLIILSLDAASESITLHASHNIVIVEPSPVPARNAQAIARAHRKGQKHPVLARILLLPGTLDARLMSIIARKMRDISKVLDDPAKTLALSGEISHLALDFPDTM